MKRIVLTGGGTAGHVTPNLALLPHLRAEGWEVLYIGSENGIEKTLMEQVYRITVSLRGSCGVIFPARISAICSEWYRA